MNIRPVTAADVPHLERVLDGTQLFPSEMLEDMLAPFLAGDGSALWLTWEDEGTPVALAYAVPEELADGTWNMLALGVLPERQGQGIGAALVRELEARLRERDVRLLIVDTSGTSDFDGARAFYRSPAYAEEARIRDYWAAGDDKVTFRKALSRDRCRATDAARLTPRAMPRAMSWQERPGRGISRVRTLIVA